jgi:hypothetical protein
MKKFLSVSFVFLLCSFSSEKPKSKMDAFFACNYAHEVVMDVNQFTSLLNQPLCVKDSSSRIYKVEGFEITYAERGLYQDSSGLPIVTTDYTFDKCTGDSIPSKWKSIFKERAYKGDTIFIERVSAKDSSNQFVACRGIKLILK